MLFGELLLHELVVEDLNAGWDNQCKADEYALETEHYNGKKSARILVGNFERYRHYIY